MPVLAMLYEYQRCNRNLLAGVLVKEPVGKVGLIGMRRVPSKPPDAGFNCSDLELHSVRPLYGAGVPPAFVMRDASDGR